MSQNPETVLNIITIIHLARCCPLPVGKNATGTREEPSDKERARKHKRNHYTNYKRRNMLSHSLYSSMSAIIINHIYIAYIDAMNYVKQFTW